MVVGPSLYLKLMIQRKLAFVIGLECTQIMACKLACSTGLYIYSVFWPTTQTFSVSSTIFTSISPLSDLKHPSHSNQSKAPIPVISSPSSLKFR